MVASRERSTKLRWFIGLLVLVAVVVILGLKNVSGSPLIALSEDGPGVGTGALLGPTLAEQEPISAQTDAPAIGPAVAPQDDDPFPTDPAAQVDWVLRHKKPAMVLFHSTNCKPCKIMEELVAKVRSDYEPDLVFIDVITNERSNLELVQSAGIRAIPTSFFIQRSGQGKRFVGALPEDELRAELTYALEGE